MKSLDAAPYLDFFDPAFIADPAPVIDAIRRESPIARTPIGALVVEHATVVALLALMLWVLASGGWRAFTRFGFGFLTGRAYDQPGPRRAYDSRSRQFVESAMSRRMSANSWPITFAGLYVSMFFVSP